MRRAACLATLLFLGFVAATAIPGRSAVPQLTITTALPPITTALPPITTALPPITTTLPVTTTLPKVTTTLPRVTTTLPVTTTVPRLTTTLPVTTTLPRVTTALPTTTAVVPKVTTNATSPPVGAASPGGVATIFPSLQPGSSSPQQGGAASSAGLFATSSGGPSTAAPVTRLRTSRPYLTLRGPKALRRTTLVFKLRRAARVRFTVVEVFPLCRVVGSFTVRGHKGLNRFRFNGRVRGKLLPAGTYQIGLRTKRGRLLRVTIAILDAPVSSSAEVASARKRNVCGATSSFSSLPGLTLLPPIEGKSAAAASASANKPHVLGVDVTAPRNLIRDIGKNPFALVALALAVLLLGAAAFPQAATPGGRAVELIARERSVLVLGGAAALTVGIVMLALT